MRLAWPKSEQFYVQPVLRPAFYPIFFAGPKLAGSKIAGTGLRGRAGSLDPVVVGMGRVGTRPDRPIGLRSGQFPNYFEMLLTVVTRVSEIPVHLTGELADCRLM